jgi:uncharacterized SAM-binding protein YcdF (DUF218 family)
MVEMSSDAKTAPPGHETATEEDIPPAKPARAVGRRRKWAGRAIGLGIVVLLLGVTAGFLRFAEHVAALEPPGQLDATDAIVVLTGGSQRIDQAITLLKDGIGQRLLISGVNPRTTGREIQAMTSGSPELFDCCVDIGHDAIDTIGNANETARWINEHGFGRVLIVTNNYHIPRSLLELRRVDRSHRFRRLPGADGRSQIGKLAGEAGSRTSDDQRICQIFLGLGARHRWNQDGKRAAHRPLRGLDRGFRRPFPIGSAVGGARLMV